jgi:hypothetical protein
MSKPDYRGFAIRCFDEWPELMEIDACELESLGMTYGILVPRTVFERCGDYCNCADYVDAAKFSAGVSCYSVAKEGGE